MIIERKSTEKKMQSSFELQAPVCRPCLPPTLKNTPGKGWRIEYYFINPFTQATERRAICLNTFRKKCRTQSDFRVMANRLIQVLTSKLALGWTPLGVVQATAQGATLIPLQETSSIPMPQFAETEAQKRARERAMTPVKDLFERYLKEKERETKKKTFSSYASHLRTLTKWLDKNYGRMKISDFTAEVAVEYMDYFYNDRKVVSKKKNEEHSMGANTYNNTVKTLRVIFGWIVAKNYLSENPFKNIDLKKKTAKKRVVISDDERRRISEYFEKVCPNYLTLCHLVFTSFIRPIEASRIQVKNIHLAEKYIYMPEDITKNKYPRNAPLSDELCERLGRMIKGANGEDFLFGKDYKPGPVAILSNSYAKRWDTMRRNLKIPENRQLYSLRDTGLTLLLRATSPDIVMKAADHHDLSITTRYIGGIDPDLVAKVNEKAPKFFGSTNNSTETEVDDETERLLDSLD